MFCGNQQKKAPTTGPNSIIGCRVIGLSMIRARHGISKSITHKIQCWYTLMHKRADTFSRWNFPSKTRSITRLSVNFEQLLFLEFFAWKCHLHGNLCRSCKWNPLKMSPLWIDGRKKISKSQHVIGTAHAIFERINKLDKNQYLNVWTCSESMLSSFGIRKCLWRGLLEIRDAKSQITAIYSYCMNYLWVRLLACHFCIWVQCNFALLPSPRTSYIIKYKWRAHIYGSCVVCNGLKYIHFHTYIAIHARYLMCKRSANEGVSTIV